MNEEIIKSFQDWYNETIGSLTSNDEDIKQGIIAKRQHTLRVYENIQKLGNSLELSKNDLKLAEAIALFHDVGRFYQYLEYKTFVDAVKDHAKLGIAVLENYRVLDVLSQEEKRIILTAIKYHNLYQIPKIENERLILFSKLIRDADKLDIYNTHVKHFEDRSEYHKLILRKYPDIPEYTSQVIEDILNNRCPKDSYIKTYNDLKLTYIAWIFDINFKFTIKQIIENRYIERLIAVLPNTEDINKVYRHVMKYSDGRMTGLFERKDALNNN